MLGYTEQKNSDVIIFLEGDEIDRLETGKIEGTYFNVQDPSKTGQLEIVVSEGFIQPLKTSVEMDKNQLINHFLLEMKPQTYSKLKERRTYGLHEGYRHITLLNASNLNSLSMMEQNNYHQLKWWEDPNYQPECLE